MKKKDLIGYASELENLKRKEILLPKSFDNKFCGFEIEASVTENTKNKMQDEYKEILISERSISKGIGVEISTHPFLINEKSISNLKELSNSLKKYKAIFDVASFQINLDTIYKNDSELKNFLLFLAAYDDILFYFYMGNDSDLRKSFFKYSNTIGYFAKEYIDKYMTKEEFISSIRSKNLELALKNNNKILEFRGPNSTFEFDLWINYLITFSYMMDYVKNNELNINTITKYLDKFDLFKISSVNYNLDKATEFVNMIFKNDEDKIYFFKQYLEKEKVKRIIYQK